MMYTFNCKGKPVMMDKPLIMGIINYTDDSFYAGSRVQSDEKALAKAERLAQEGANIIDIGGQSTRPGSGRISAAEEIKKLEHLIPEIKKRTQKLISIDTYHSEVAQEAVALGADMVNDISGGTMDDKMIETVAKLNVPYICMHIKGTPENMQQMTDYEDMLQEILDFFIRKIEECRVAGIHDIIIDPGFGFAKNINQNFYLLKHLHLFSILQKPTLVGLSRKSTIYRTLGVTPAEALNGTTVMNTIALLNGADILRVHDVKEAVEVRKLVESYQESSL